MDRLTPDARSRNMSKIRSKSALDDKLHGYLKGHHIKHQMHPKIPGSPDALVFPDTLVYVDGCFWHSCPKCGTTPKTRKNYWVQKLMRTQIRDKRNTQLLRRQGWQVVRIWEHRFMQEPESVVEELKRKAQLSRRRVPSQ